MTLLEFNALSLELRCDAIYEWGFFVSKHKTKDTNKVLYLLNEFFAEMTISLEDNKVLDVRGFTKKDFLREPTYPIAKDNPFIKTMLVQTKFSAALRAA